MENSGYFTLSKNEKKFSSSEKGIHVRVVLSSECQLPAEKFILAKLSEID